MGLGETFQQSVRLGLEPKELSLIQISLSGIIVFVAAIVIVRIVDRRFLAKMTALDAFMLGSDCLARTGLSGSRMSAQYRFY